jgi:hypothetical protein
MTGRGRWLAAVLIIGARGAAAIDGLPSDTYQDQLGIRLWLGAAQPDLYDARVAIHDENWAMQNDSWNGAIGESALHAAMAGGLEVSYGLLADAKFLLALDGSGSAAHGHFEGQGPKTLADPIKGLERQEADRLERLPEFGQEVGATVLLRGYEWCRFGLTVRAGPHELAGATERGSEYGPLRTYWWNRDLSGTGVGGMLGLEWEWLTPPPSLPFALTGFVLVGYRWLQFRSVRFDYTDATGAHVTGGYKNADGTNRVLDFSGPVARFGLQLPFSFALTND